MVKAGGIVTLLTDFGTDDVYVGSLKGAILAVNRRASLVDLSHTVTPFGILQAAFLLDSAWRSFPAGTVHLVVVDPGVGSPRLALALEIAEHLFVGPDNGVFTYLPEPPSVCVQLPTPTEASATFHGRDVFAPAAARLAAGEPLGRLGAPGRPPTRLADAWAVKVGEAWRAQVLHTDRFGNVITNLPLRSFDRLQTVNGVRLRPVRTYADGAEDELIALVGSSGRIELASREGSAASRLRVRPGEHLLVS